MPHEHADTIEQIVTGVLEQLAFVFADRAEADELPAGVDGAIAVSMGIRGAASGRLTVASGPGICLELAGNLTGQDPEEVGSELATQALMELANVLCGQLLTEIAGVEPVFDLDPPHPIADPASTWSALCRDDQAVAFLAEDCPMLVRFELESSASLAA